jgi:hypothetical protein
VARRLQRRQHFLRVRRRRDLVVDVLHLAVLADDDRDPLGRARLRVGRAVGDRELLVDVAQQRIRELALRAEGAVRGLVVERRAEDGDALLVELGLQVTEALAFGRSAGRVGLGVEPEHQRLAGELGERARAAFVVAHGERGSGGADGEHGISG